MGQVQIRMKSTPESSSMDAYGYLQQASMLFVRFQGGNTYGYSGVPKTVFSDLRAASSKGVFFNRFIRHDYDSFEVTSSPEFVFIDEDSQEVIPVRNALDKMPSDPRWAW